jgi:hypothetical protein
MLDNGRKIIIPNHNFWVIIIDHDEETIISSPIIGFIEDEVIMDAHPMLLLDDGYGTWIHDTTPSKEYKFIHERSIDNVLAKYYYPNSVYKNYKKDFITPPVFNN